MSQRAIEHQPRDIALLRDLFVSRVMTLAHIAALHFEGRSEAAKKRVQKLKAAGLIAERPRRARDPGVLHLSRQGFQLLTDLGTLSDLPRLSVPAFERRAKVSDLTIRHELAVMDTKAALTPAITRSPGLSVVEFSTWPLLHEFEAHAGAHDRVRVKPDGLLRVEERGPHGAEYEHTFFLEVDRGTETLDTLIRRALCYRDHYASGGFALACGGDRSEYRDFPFRVLYVLPSEERRNNVAERLRSLTPPILTLVWLSTSTEVVEDPLGPIWLRPRDCSAAEERAVLDPTGPLQARSRGRERSTIPRCTLFADTD